MGTADDTSDDGGGHHLPAVTDFPRGFGEASWWPYIASVGAAGLYVGAALYFIGHSSSLIPDIVGPVVFGVGVILVLVGIFGWLYHAFVVDYWERAADEHSGNLLRFGMLLFLTTDVFTFGAGFVYFFFIRAGGWPPAELPNVLSSIVLINTVLLVLSSFTYHFSEVALRKDNRRRYLGLLGATLVLGAVFVLGQVYEYYLFIVEEGFTLTSGIFGSAFFTLTGFHGLHVTMGVILIAIVLARSLSGQYSADRHTSVSTISMYWHFVDVVWLFLVAVIYLGSAAGS